VIVRKQRRISAVAAARGGGVTEARLGLSRMTSLDGSQVVSMTGELDIATAERAYAFLNDVINDGYAPVIVDLGGLTFCDASGLGVLARTANHARETGRQLRLRSARPSLVKIMRITGMDSAFPELSSPVATR
jgi:anti-sigma B factor antagonist